MSAYMPTTDVMDVVLGWLTQEIGKSRPKSCAFVIHTIYSSRYIVSFGACMLLLKWAKHLDRSPPCEMSYCSTLQLQLHTRLVSSILRVPRAGVSMGAILSGPLPSTLVALRGGFGKEDPLPTEYRYWILWYTNNPVTWHTWLTWHIQHTLSSQERSHWEGARHLPVQNNVSLVVPCMRRPATHGPSPVTTTTCTRPCTLLLVCTLYVVVVFFRGCILHVHYSTMLGIST